MQKALLVLTASAVLGCGTVRGPRAAPLRGATAGCERPSFSRERLQFRCGAVVYDLLGTPVRSEEVFDIVARVGYTRRHYLARAGDRRYAFKAEQLHGERYPRHVVLETRRGFARVLLDRQGNVVESSWGADLSFD